MPFAWFLTPIGRKVGMGIAAAVLLFTIYKVWEHKVQDEAAGKEAAKHLEDDNKILAQQRQETQDQITHLQSERKAAELRELATQRVLENLNSKLTSIASQRVADREAINRVPDDKLAGDVRIRVGLPPSESTTFLASELRVVDETLSALPTMKAEIATLKQQSETSQQQVAAVKDQLAAVGKQLDTTLAYNRRLEESYKLSYDTAQKLRRRSRLNPLVLLHLLPRERKMDLPSPLSLAPAKL